MARLKQPPLVRAFDDRIVCHHPDCGDPRRGAIVGQVARREYLPQAIQQHAQTHGIADDRDPWGVTPSEPRDMRDGVSASERACEV